MRIQIILGILLLTSLAQGKILDTKFFVYFSYQEKMHIRETGEVEPRDYLLYEDDLDRHYYGIALEYRMKMTQKFSVGPAFLYQDTLHVQQRTTTYGFSACDDIDPELCVEGVSRNDLMHITYYHWYVNLYYELDPTHSLFVAPIYTFPDVNNHGRFNKYRINSGPGFHIGLNFMLTDRIAFQILWRQMMLTTRDEAIDYYGERNLDTLMFNLGYGFF